MATIRPAALESETCSAALGLNIDREQFAAQFNRRHFEVSHALAGHPLFALPRLIELANEISAGWPSEIHYDLGITDIGARWGRCGAAWSAGETIRRLESCEAWMIFKAAERSAPYARVLNDCIADLLRISGRALERQMRRKQMAIFVTSPRRITTYHMDSEVNFLLQLQGEKDISLFDRDDREVLPEREKERFWTCDANAAIYKPALQSRAEVVHLRPGSGVHIPVNAPHWVQNGDEVSVSVAILYRSWNAAYVNRYEANHFLRTRLGLQPTPPFQSPLIDALKQPLGAALHTLRRLRRGSVLDESGNLPGVPARTP